MKIAFDGSQVHETAPNPLTSDEVYERVKDVVNMFGKSQKKTIIQFIHVEKEVYFL